jgi:hypothetical protein
MPLFFLTVFNSLFTNKTTVRRCDFSVEESSLNTVKHFFLFRIKFDLDGNILTVASLRDGSVHPSVSVTTRQQNVARKDIPQSAPAP